MFRNTLLLCFLFCCVGGILSKAAGGRKLRATRAPEERIIGGTSVDIEQFPHQLSLEFVYSHSCGASIISPEWAVTAAHCTDGAFSYMLRIRAGSSTRGRGGTIHHVKTFKEHPQWNFYTLDHDVAVIKVSTPFVYTEAIQPIPLASKSPPPGTLLTVSGWGARREGAILLPSQLRAVVLPVVDHEQCSEAYTQSYDITETMLCAGYSDGGKDACQGDSGGPLVVDGELVGLVSWGIGCARAEYPGVNTDVAAVRDWVLEVTNI